MKYDFTYNGHTGEIVTPHGKIETPNFIFCATKGAIKGLLPHQIGDQQIILANTYHLMPYAERIAALGGLHKCMGWDRPLLTDSGGFQVFSLGHGSVASEIKGIRERKSSILKISEAGCKFRSPRNGDTLMLSPEKSIEIQYLLGVDLMVAFDECTPSHADYNYTKNSLARTNRWQDRCIAKQKSLNTWQQMYGILQGGIYEDLRDLAVEYVKSRNFFGYAIGGSLGKTKQEMYHIVKYTASRLGRNKPIHLLGIGEVDDLFELAPYIDTFDCVEPTRIARHGIAITPKGKKNIKNSKFINSKEPLDPTCLCYTCTHTNQGFINYLLKVNEKAGEQYLLTHNIFTMQRIMQDIRIGLATNTLDQKRLFWL